MIDSSIEAALFTLKNKLKKDKANYFLKITTVVPA